MIITVRDEADKQKKKKKNGGGGGMTPRLFIPVIDTFQFKTIIHGVHILNNHGNWMTDLFMGGLSETVTDPEGAQYAPLPKFWWLCGFFFSLLLYQNASK